MTQESLLSLKTNNSPENFAKILQAKGDIFWWDRASLWVITSHEYARFVLTSPDFSCDRTPFFISRMPNLDLTLIQNFFGVVSKMMVMSDPPEHTARRRVCYKGFTAQAMQNLRSIIDTTVSTQISKCLEKGSIEIVADLAKIVPQNVLAYFFHIPEEDRSTFYQWSNNMTQFFGGASQYRNEDGVEVDQSAFNLRRYFRSLIQKRRERPEDDFLSILLQNQQAFGLDDDEIISQAIMMLVAGQITTTDQFCNNVYTLLTTPGALSTLQSGNVSLEHAINELNRLDPAVTFLFRLAKNDTLIGDQPVKVGDVIFISTHAANRDPRVFESPHDCILTRQDNEHLSHGFGEHYCIGAKLALIQMQACFTQLLARMPNLGMNPDNPPQRNHYSLAFSGFHQIPLVF
jgi:cytochrome P450 PksS